MTSPELVPAATVGDRRSWRAIAAGAAVGVIGGLVGLGGAEFRLPLLIGMFAFVALELVRVPGFVAAMAAGSVAGTLLGGLLAGVVPVRGDRAAGRGVAAARLSGEGLEPRLTHLGAASVKFDGAQLVKTQIDRPWRVMVRDNCRSSAASTSSLTGQVCSGSETLAQGPGASGPLA